MRRILVVVGHVRHNESAQNRKASFSTIFATIELVRLLRKGKRELDALIDEQLSEAENQLEAAESGQDEDSNGDHNGGNDHGSAPSATTSGTSGSPWLHSSSFNISLQPPALYNKLGGERCLNHVNTEGCGCVWVSLAELAHNNFVIFALRLARRLSTSRERAVRHPRWRSTARSVKRRAGKSRDFQRRKASDTVRPPSAPRF